MGIVYFRGLPKQGPATGGEGFTTVVMEKGGCRV